MISFIISHPADAGQRIDRFVRKYLPNAPLGGIFKMLRIGKIKINGKKKDQTYKLELGDEVSFYLTDIEMADFRKNSEFTRAYPQEDTIQNEGMESPIIESPIIKLEILYEDEYLMVINKPAGINVHPGDHKTTEVSLIDKVQDYLRGKYDSLTFRPALVHRIDRDTSGCLLIAKDKSVLESLLAHLQAHEMNKIYHTIVLGIPNKTQDTIRAKLLRIENAKNEAKVRVDEFGQSAITHYTLVTSKLLPVKNSVTQKQDVLGTSISLLECRIETGRTHQIRVHMAYIGHPVLADRAYGDKSINSYIKRNFGISRQLLHARSLSFVHPKTQKKLTIEAPYPVDFTKLITS